MCVVDNLNIAVENLAYRVQGPHADRLATAQQGLEQADTHLREAPICSAVDIRQPGPAARTIEAASNRRNTMTSENKWTPEAIHALGPTTDLPTLGAIFECSRWKAYQMARQEEWERLGIKVLSIGSKYRVVVQSILDVLGYGLAEPTTLAGDQQSTAPPDGRLPPSPGCPTAP
jgi:hypothetical protein